MSVHDRGRGPGHLSRRPTPSAAGFNPLDAIQKIIAIMQNRRVDFVGIGDSNQILGGYGWDHGFQYALTTLGYPMHATAIVSQNEGDGNGAGQGYLYTRIGALMGATTGAPADLERYYDVGAGRLEPARSTFVADGNVVANNVMCGLLLSANSPLDNGAALAFDIHYGTFDSGAGAFRPFSRLEVSPYSTLTEGSTISTNAGVFGMQRATITLSADATRASKAISGKPIRTGTVGITGPYFSTYYRWRNPARTAGWAYGTLDFRGGQSTRTAAYDLQQATDETLTHYFGILRADQGEGAKTIVICINEGLNDRNETLASVGPSAVADGDSPEAFVDNHIAIKSRIEEIWVLNGWDTDELWWLIVPSHPVDDPDDAKLTAYRAAIATEVANWDRAQVVDLSTLTNEAEMLVNGWYASSGSDRNHLTQTGYEQLSLRVLS